MFSRFLIRPALAAAVVLAALPATAQIKIDAGVAAYNEALAPFYAAVEKGYFEEAGIEVEMISFKGGGATVQAFVGGSVQLCLCAADHVLRLAARGMPADILVGLDGHHSYALLSKGDATFTDLASLKGEKIAITSPGSLTDNTLRYAIKELGMDPDTDFEIIATGGGSSMRAAMDTDQVAAGMLITTDVVDMLQTEGAYKIVTDFREMPYPSFEVIVLKSWMEENPETVQALGKALVKAIDDLHADPAFAEAVIKVMYPNFSDQLVSGVAESMTSRMPIHGVVSEESFDTLNKILTSSDPSVSAVDLSVVYNPTLLSE
jgi:NitT/TauT family transport system substrate-binding protein